MTDQNPPSWGEPPADPPGPHQPGPPDPPAQPNQPYPPAQPSQPYQPAQPGQPYQPGQSYPPAQPGQPYQPYSPGQPYPPDPSAGPLPPPYSQNYPYGDPYAYPGHPVQPPTDGMAIASLVVSCIAALGLCASGVGGLLGIVGAVLGHVSRRRIRNTGAGGDGMALAGVIVGWSVAAIGLILISILVVFIVIGENTDPTY